MLCVTNTTVRPRARQSAASSSSRRCRVNSSSAPNGSSISRRSGVVTSARAMEARICMPPESSRGKWRPNSASPTWSSAPRAASVAALPLDPGEIERQPDVRLDARPGHQRRRLEHEAEAAAGAAGRGEVAAPPAELASARRDEPGDEIEERGLAAAGGPEQRQEFAALDGEVDRRERARAVRVALLDAGQRDDRLACRRDGAQGRTLTLRTIDSVQAGA